MATKTVTNYDLSALVSSSTTAGSDIFFGSKKKDKATPKGTMYVDKQGQLRSTNGNDLITQEQLLALGKNAGMTLVKERTRRVRVEVPVEVRPIKKTLDDFPGKVGVFIRQAWLDPQLNYGMKEMAGRWMEFKSSEAALLAGMGVWEPSRRWLDERLDEMWAVPQKPPALIGQLVVGAGLHAAIYCTARHARGLSAPWVIEQSDRVGGIFACSKGPSFYLNSRNRPGQLSIPGDLQGSLNVLPEAMVQPSDIDGSEYFPNDVMAWVIRVHLAMFSAGVILNREVTSFSGQSFLTGIPGRRVRCGGGSNATDFFSSRTVVAPGLGNQTNPFTAMQDDLKEVISFRDFMAKMDSPFPLRGLKRVAVIGAGDSGKTAIEVLTGQGPRPGMSVLGIDHIERIDWYGLRSGETCESFRAVNRSRYMKIGGLLPRQQNPSESSRVTPRGKALSVSGDFGGARVEGRAYDLVINCTGFTSSTMVAEGRQVKHFVKQNTVAMTPDGGADLFYVGPGAVIAANASEAVLIKAVPANAVAIWRYANRTAALAESLA